MRATVAWSDSPRVALVVARYVGMRTTVVWSDSPRGALVVTQYASLNTLIQDLAVAYGAVFMLLVPAQYLLHGCVIKITQNE